MEATTTRCQSIICQTSKSSRSSTKTSSTADSSRSTTKTKKYFFLKRMKCHERSPHGNSQEHHRFFCFYFKQTNISFSEISKFHPKNTKKKTSNCLIEVTIENLAEAQTEVTERLDEIFSQKVCRVCEFFSLNKRTQSFVFATSATRTSCSRNKSD